MSSISDVTSTTSAITSTTSSTSSVSLDKDDFLTLLVAQLENQDPLNPQDGSEYVAQLAQFSALEQAITTNESLETLTDLALDMSNSTALNMLGQTVTIETSTFDFDGSSVDLGFNLSETATEASINIFDEDDSLVCTLSLGAFSSGENFVTWNGTDSDGNALGAGEYSFQVVAKNEDEVLDITEMIRENVSGIDLNDGETLLITSAGNFTTNQVTKISQPSQ